MSEITNTTAEAKRDWLALLIGGLDIEGQERGGQSEIVRSSLVPVESHSPEEDYIALGFTFGDVVSDDPLFRHATLPTGWTREGGDHAMWSGICDERGIERVAVFYKAAFYDRRAHMGIVNVGQRLCGAWIYSDDENPELHPGMTNGELHDCRVAACDYLLLAERHPDIYADRVLRAEALIEAIDARYIPPTA